MIPVSQPVVSQVQNYEDFTGQTDAVQVVDVRASGHWLSEQDAVQGGVRSQKGDVLFQIDARPYQAQLDQAVAQVTSNEESYKLAKSIYTRDLVRPRRRQSARA